MLERTLKIPTETDKIYLYKVLKYPRSDQIECT